MQPQHTLQACYLAIHEAMSQSHPCSKQNCNIGTLQLVTGQRSRAGHPPASYSQMSTLLPDMTASVASAAAPCGLQQSSDTPCWLGVARTWAVRAQLQRDARLRALYILTMPSAPAAQHTAACDSATARICVSMNLNPHSCMCEWLRVHMCCQATALVAGHIIKSCAGIVAWERNASAHCSHVGPACILLTSRC
jgi:hypothetical protein